MKHTFIFIVIFISVSAEAQLKLSTATSYLNSKRSSDYEIQKSIENHLSKFDIKVIAFLETNKYLAIIDHVSSLESAFIENIKNEIFISREVYSVYESKKDLKGTLDAFVKAYPNHFFPYFLRGTYYVGQGWQKRGGNYYDNTAKKQINGMTYYHKRALPDLKKSLEINPNFMHSYLIRASVYRPKRATEELMWKDLQAALSLKKASFDAWTEYLNASMPRWYGNEDLLKNRLEESQKSIKINPRLIGMKAFVARNYAEKYWYANKKDKAIQAYIDAEKLGDHWWVTGEVARVLLDAGKNNNLACKYTDKAIRLEPYSIRNNRFSLYCEANRKLGHIY